MSDYQIYTFILCVIVFIMLTGASILCLYLITRFSLQLIRTGAEDQRIARSYLRDYVSDKHSKLPKYIDRIFSFVVCIFFIIIFVFSILVRAGEITSADWLPSLRVVRTGSMAEKNEKNEYLVKNDLNDQIGIFDLIETAPLPGEMELELYDIVVYEVDEMLIIHRIVGIEEPNERHPDCRYFLLQGDAVEAPDRFPVLYEQMRAIYRGHHIPFVGSFILFMQSPAGWLCAILIIVAMFAMPILDKMIATAELDRLNRKFPYMDPYETYVFDMMRGGEYD